MTEDEMVGWHNQLDRHEFEQAPGVSNGQGRMNIKALLGNASVPGSGQVGTESKLQ